MRPTKRPLSRAEKKCLVFTSIIAGAALSFIAGMATIRAYDDEYRTPYILENLYMEVQKGLIDHAKTAFFGDDLAMLSFVSGLRQTGVAAAYNWEIRELRGNGFEASFDTKDIAALKAVDTRMADRLLIEAMAKLGDEDLFGVLSENSNLFLAESPSRLAMLSDTDSSDQDLRYHHLYWAHTTLSDKERDELTACFKKLEKKRIDQPEKHLRVEAGIGTCIVEEAKKTRHIFNPREYLKQQ